MVVHAALHFPFYLIFVDANSSNSVISCRGDSVQGDSGGLQQEFVDVKLQAAFQYAVVRIGKATYEK